MAQQTEQNNSSNATPAQPAAPAPVASPAPIIAIAPEWRLTPSSGSDAGRTLNMSGVTLSDQSSTATGGLNLHLVPREHYDQNRSFLPPSTFSTRGPSNPLHPSYSTDLPVIGSTQFNLNLTNPKKAVGLRITF